MWVNLRCTRAFQETSRRTPEHKFSARVSSSFLAPGAWGLEGTSRRAIGRALQNKKAYSQASEAANKFSFGLTRQEAYRAAPCRATPRRDSSARNLSLGDGDFTNSAQDKLTFFPSRRSLVLSCHLLILTTVKFS